MSEEKSLKRAIIKYLNNIIYGCWRGDDDALRTLYAFGELKSCKTCKCCSSCCF